jgi:glycine/D-amino acid oxidase-like deaminating enzyme
MGLIYSTLRTSYLSIKGLIEVISSLNADFSALRARISQSPGLPGSNPTISFWEQDPPHPDLVKIQSPVLSTEAEIVIIGSGITGAAIAKTILEEWAGGQAGKGIEESRKIVVLEAREICSGATGRNGGQIKVVPYDAYVRIKKRLGSKAARKIVEFQMRHLQHLLDVARDEGWDGAECRKVETVDVFFHGDSWMKARKAVDSLRGEWKAVGDEIKVWDKEEAIEACQNVEALHPLLT